MEWPWMKYQMVKHFTYIKLLLDQLHVTMLPPRCLLQLDVNVLQLFAHQRQLQQDVPSTFLDELQLVLNFDHLVLRYFHLVHTAKLVVE